MKYLKKRKLNDKKLLNIQKKTKRGLYNEEIGPIYYYSINNKVYKYTRVRKYVDYEDYRCSCSACKAKGKYVCSLKKFIILNDHIKCENHSYVIALLMKDKILNSEITKKDWESDEKILNYFQGYFNL